MTTNIKVIAVGRLVPVKRFDVLIDAWREIPNFLSIVGDGPERTPLETKAKGLGLEDRVHFLGERDDVPHLLKDHQILVNTSEREGFAYVVLEALQAGLVVISTATGIALELLPDDYLINSLDSTSVTETVKRLIKKFERSRREFEPVWEVAQDMTVKKMVGETLRVYRHSLTAG